MATWYNNNGINYGPMGNIPTQTEPIKMENMLTSEDMKMLSQETRKHFITPITKFDMAATRCTHKKDGHFSIEVNPDGTAYCTICGEHFHVYDPRELDDEEVAADCEKVIDYLQTIKTFYTDMTPQDITLFEAIPIIRRIPQMMKAARANYNRLDMYSANPFLANPNGYVSSAAMMNAIQMGYPVGYGAMPSYQPQMGPQQWGPQAQPQWGPQQPQQWTPQGQPMGAPQGYNYQMQNPQGMPQQMGGYQQAPQTQQPQQQYAGNPNFAQPPQQQMQRNPAQPNPNYAAAAPNPIGAVVQPTQQAPQTTQNVTVTSPDERPNNGFTVTG